MDVYLNGSMVPRQQASVSIDDAGFQHGVGIFETMAAYHGQVFRLSNHLSRLAESAKTLGLTPKLDTNALAKAVEQVIAHNSIDRARIRLTLTAGPISLLPRRANREGEAPAEPRTTLDPGSTGASPSQAPPAAPLPTLLIVPSEPTVYDPQYFERGITVLIAPAGANPFDVNAGHKTLNYWPRLRTLRQAASAGAGEAIWLNVTNHLASGAISNLFLVKNGELFTPIARGEEVQGALPAPVLPGITREAVIELAASMGIAVHRQMLSVEDMLEADEAFLTNSSWHVLPVSKVEKETIGKGKAGELTTKLRERLLEVIEEETGDD